MNIEKIQGQLEQSPFNILMHVKKVMLLLPSKTFEPYSRGTLSNYALVPFLLDGSDFSYVDSDDTAAGVISAFYTKNSYIADVLHRAGRLLKEESGYVVGLLLPMAKSLCIQKNVGCEGCINAFTCFSRKLYQFELVFIKEITRNDKGAFLFINETHYLRKDPDIDAHNYVDSNAYRSVFLSALLSKAKETLKTEVDIKKPLNRSDNREGIPIHYSMGTFNGRSDVIGKDTLGVEVRLRDLLTLKRRD